MIANWTATAVDEGVGPSPLVRAGLPEAAAVAAIASKDVLGAQAARRPMGAGVEGMGISSRDKYERLFDLIAEQTLCAEVRGSAKAIMEARFREAEIRALDSELRDKLSPARMRYRTFLGVVKKMIDGKTGGDKHEMFCTRAWRSQWWVCWLIGRRHCKAIYLHDVRHGRPE